MKKIDQNIKYIPEVIKKLREEASKIGLPFISDSCLIQFDKAMRKQINDELNGNN